MSGHGRVARAVALLSMAGMLGACGSGLPENFVAYTGDGYSVAAPRDWSACRRQTTTEDEQAITLEIRGPAGPGRLPPFIQVSNQGTQRKFEHAVRFNALLLAIQPGYRELSREEADVAGATEAMVITFRQRPPVPNPGVQQLVLTGRSVLAAAPDGAVINLVTVTEEEDAERLATELGDLTTSFKVGQEASAEGSSVDSLAQCG
jgi:hypothetical protein